MVKPKVTHVLYSGLGGHGNVFRNFINACEKSAIESSVIFYGIEPVREEYKSFCKSKDIPFKYIKKKRGIDLLFFLRHILFLIRAKPQAVFLHGSYLIGPVVIARVLAKFRVIVRETQANHLKSKFEKISLKLALRTADHLVFLTQEFKAETLARNKVGSKVKVHIIANGIDLSKLRKERDYGTVPINVSMVARLVNIKDTITLIKAFNNAKIKATGLILTIAGDGEEYYKLLELKNSLSIDTVHFTGVLSEHKVVELLNSSDMYVHPTFGETLSTSIIMAMASGLPIISNDVPGVNNMLVNMENAILVKTKDPDELASAMMKMCEDNKLREKLGANNRNRAIELYSSKVMVDKYLPLLLGK